ncbi:MAG: hypothetical protein ACR2O3_00895 [Rhizobiaceae bacterium]
MMIVNILLLAASSMLFVFGLKKINLWARTKAAIQEVRCAFVTISDTSADDLLKEEQARKTTFSLIKFLSIAVPSMIGIAFLALAPLLAGIWFGFSNSSSLFAAAVSLPGIAVAFVSFLIVTKL